MRQAVDVFRTSDMLIVESTSMQVRGPRVADGWVETVPVSALSSVGVGEVVRAALENSGVIDREDAPASAPGVTVASRTGGFASEDAMLAAGVSSAGVGLKAGVWKVTPMVNMGPGQGWAGLAEAPRSTHEGEWSDEELGAAVLRALDDAQALSAVQPAAAVSSAEVARIPDDGLVRSVSVTGHGGRVAVESLTGSGPEDLPNGWVEVLEAGSSDAELGAVVLAGLAQSESSLPAEPVEPAATALGVASDAALAVPGAARVLVESSVPGVLYVMATENLGPGEGFVGEEHPDQREVEDIDPAIVGMSVRLALGDATG